MAVPKVTTNATTNATTQDHDLDDLPDGPDHGPDHAPAIDSAIGRIPCIVVDDESDEFAAAAAADDDEFDHEEEEDYSMYTDDLWDLDDPYDRSVPLQLASDDRDLVAALSRQLREAIQWGCFCVILHPDGIDPVFVQCIATPVGFHVEAVGNQFLGGTPHELDAARLALLERLGFDEPDLPLDPDDRPSEWATSHDFSCNWSIAVGGDDAPERAAALMLTTLTTVYRLPGEPQFEVTVFPASSQDYEWDPVEGAIHVPEE